MNSSCQFFARRKAMSAGSSGTTVRNFLIIASEEEGTSALADEMVATLARRLNEDGFAYVARSGQKEMADDSFGVRHLPLRGSLPSFGLMTAVVVIGDEAWARRAASEYPDADVFLVGPPMVGESSADPPMLTISSVAKCRHQRPPGLFDAEWLSADCGDESGDSAN